MSKRLQDTGTETANIRTAIAKEVDKAEERNDYWNTRQDKAEKDNQEFRKETKEMLSRIEDKQQRDSSNAPRIIQVQLTMNVINNFYNLFQGSPLLVSQWTTEQSESLSNVFLLK